MANEKNDDNLPESQHIADQPAPPELFAEHDLIPANKLSQLKIKIGKAHRKESDWDVIKEILGTHRILTAEPMKKLRRIHNIDHVLCRDGILLVFTNLEDCQSYINSIIRETGGDGRYFMIGSITFGEVVDIANREQMDIYIDPKNEINHRFIRYAWKTEKLAVDILVHG